MLNKKKDPAKPKLTQTEVDSNEIGKHLEKTVLLQLIRGKSRLDFFEYQFEGAKGAVEQMSRFVETSGKSLLDIGCGIGGRSAYYASQGINVTAIDNNAYDSLSLFEAKKISESKQITINYCIADAKSLPLKENSFDIICMDSVIEHLEKPELVMSECRRLLKKDGCIFISFPLYYSTFGGHLDDYIIIPWFHLLPPAFVKFGLRLCKSKPGFIDVNYVERLYLSLNKMTSAKYKRIAKSLKFDIIYTEENFFLPHDAILFSNTLKKAIGNRSLESFKQSLEYFSFFRVFVYLFLKVLYKFPFNRKWPFYEFIVSGIRSVLKKRAD